VSTYAYHGSGDEWRCRGWLGSDLKKQRKCQSVRWAHTPDKEQQQQQQQQEEEEEEEEEEEGEGEEEGEEEEEEEEEEEQEQSPAILPSLSFSTDLHLRHVLSERKRLRHVGGFLRGVVPVAHKPEANVCLLLPRDPVDDGVDVALRSAVC
jgi:D-mannonate dehydratase